MSKERDPEGGERHSVWLMPCRADETLLSTIVEELAAAFASPVFQPHLTLVEDMPASAGRLAGPIAEIASAAAAFPAPVTSISATDAFFRSLYAAFEPAGELLRLKEACMSRLAAGSAANFLPHVSLAYGPVAPSAKAAAQERLAGRLAGRPITFDRLCVVRSAQTIPIAEWRIATSHNLGPR
ncbi:2'-5' RNA ligase family protein [Chelatococcus sp. SYSU_G07232]|uniref:2'-5' RNA ligase family protein n=1 Tax=Chelatococcus albus TaxID=3047466 RepID=A0ABT7AKK8_9HYPH|nr:2'-5' RNA ligase family protein [Chelatococcus sp. SYSU_G07232]MDJ1159893.1 2'-5' RNA ligase family protein [Chelatococcus sp. SYSU_G07232]